MLATLDSATVFSASLSVINSLGEKINRTLVKGDFSRQCAAKKNVRDLPPYSAPGSDFGVRPSDVSSFHVYYGHGLDFFHDF